MQVKKLKFRQDTAKVRYLLEFAVIKYNELKRIDTLLGYEESNWLDMSILSNTEKVYLCRNLLISD